MSEPLEKIDTKTYTMWTAIVRMHEDALNAAIDRINELEADADHTGEIISRLQGRAKDLEAKLAVMDSYIHGDSTPPTNNGTRGGSNE